MSSIDALNMAAALVSGLTSIWFAASAGREVPSPVYVLVFAWNAGFAGLNLYLGLT